MNHTRFNYGLFFIFTVVLSLLILLIYSNFKLKERIEELEFHSNNYIDICIERIKQCKLQE